MNLFFKEIFDFILYKNKPSAEAIKDIHNQASANFVEISHTKIPEYFSNTGLVDLLKGYGLGLMLLAFAIGFCTHYVHNLSKKDGEQLPYGFFTIHTLFVVALNVLWTSLFVSIVYTSTVIIKDFVDIKDSVQFMEAVFSNDAYLRSQQYSIISFNWFSLVEGFVALIGRMIIGLLSYGRFAVLALMYLLGPFMISMSLIPVYKDRLSLCLMTIIQVSMWPFFITISMIIIKVLMTLLGLQSLTIINNTMPALVVQIIFLLMLGGVPALAHQIFGGINFGWITGIGVFISILAGKAKGLL